MIQYEAVSKYCETKPAELKVTASNETKCGRTPQIFLTQATIAGMIELGQTRVEN